MAHLQHQVVGRIRRLAGRFPFGRVQQRLQVGRPARVAQLVAQGVAKGDGAVNHAHAHVFQAQLGVGRRVAAYHRLALAREITAAQDQFAPQLARFPVAVVGGRVAKAQEDGQRQADQGKRDGREDHLVVEQGAVAPGDERGDQGVDDQRDADARQDGTAHDEEQPQRRRTLAHDHVVLPVWERAGGETRAR
ncbi:hypothetical protein D3C72_1269460 [compost metagenome]